MPLYIKQNNTWTKLNKFHNVNGTNKEVLNQYHKVNGVWKPAYSYSWNVSNWSSCSKPCGTGIQTRTATCVRNDGVIKEDKFCTSYGISKPITQQNCNTQACTTTIYMCGQADDEQFLVAQVDYNLVDILPMYIHMGSYDIVRCATIQLNPDYFYSINGIEYAYLRLSIYNNATKYTNTATWNMFNVCGEIIYNPYGFVKGGCDMGDPYGCSYCRTSYDLGAHDVWIRLPIVRII